MIVTHLRSIFLILASFAALSLGACNTVEGMGEDVQGGGEAVEDTAKETKRAL